MLGPHHGDSYTQGSQCSIWSPMEEGFFPLPFRDVILDYVARQECYSFLNGFSKYNQVFIRA